MNAHSVLEAAPGAQERLSEIRLRPMEWGVYFACDGARALGEVGRRFDLSWEALEPIVMRLVNQGLLAEGEITLDQYLAHQARKLPPETPVPLQTLLEGNPPTPAEPEPIVAPPPKRVLLLGAVIDWIVSRAASQTEGQLAVYRTFLRIPPTLLKRNRIVSMTLVNNATRIEDDELSQAVESAVKETLRCPLPAQVWE